jgi:CIC family chloride channel protein
MLPTMLACIISVAVARLAYTDSVYTQGLRMRGVHVGAGSDLVLLRRITVEQIPLDPVTILSESAPVQQILDLGAMTSAYDFVVADSAGRFEGMVLSADMNPVLLDRDAIPLLVVRDIMRTDIRPVRTSDDLATVLDSFSSHDVNHLPVCTPSAPEKVIGLISRSALIRKYHQTLSSA